MVSLLVERAIQMSMRNEHQDLEAFPPPVIMHGDPALPARLESGVEYHKAGDLNKAAEIYSEILNMSPGNPQALAFMGIIYANAGDLDAAYSLISRSIRENSYLADSHYALGNTLYAQSRIDLAKTAYLRALALGHPDAETRLGNIISILGGDSRLESYRLLAEMLISLGKPVDALGRIRMALHSTPDDALLWVLFSRCLMSIRFQSRVEKAVFEDLSRALFVEGIDYQLMVGAILSAMQFEPDMSPLLSIKGKYDNLDTTVIQRFLSGELQSVDKNQPFCRLMKVTIINDIRIERLLTALRRAFLEFIVSSEDKDGVFIGQHMKLLCSIAQQCFQNEYIYAVTDAESRHVDQLVQDVDRHLESDKDIPPQWLAVIAAYRPLFRLVAAEQLAGSRWPVEVADIVQMQVIEQIEEEKIKNDIKQLSDIRKGVSQLVRSQYEDNPFPRWPSLPTLGPSLTFEEHITSLLPHLKNRNIRYPIAPRILVAGCGTGLSAGILAKRIRNASITGVDLSLGSLAYATRKSLSLGLSNIDYIQADILDLATTGMQYDHINSFGVLHHMEDTEAGLHVLKDCLVTGGTMMLGLYSTIARRAVAQGGEYIAEKGYTATAEDMRQCRQDLICMTDSLFARSIVNSLAFYSMSNFRDLLFHYQEHTYTLLQVKDMLDKLDLQFLGFEISNPRVTMNYRRRYPQDADMTSLDLWHEFELENPDTFGNCYAFWVCKQS